MAKRIGANARNKMAQRRGKRRSAAKFVVPVVLIVIAALAAGPFVVTKCKEMFPSVPRLFDRWKSKPVSSVVLQGAVHEKSGEILRRSGLKLPVTMDRLKNEYLPAMSRTCSWIDKAYIERTDGTTATIRICERKPVAMLQSGKIVFVDAEGICLPLDPHRAIDLPLVSGLCDSMDGDGIRRLLAVDCRRMNRFFDEAARFDSSFARRIAQVRFAADATLCLTVSGCGATIKIDESDIAGRLQRLMLVLETIQNDPLAPARIDLSYRNLAFVTVPGATKIAAADGIAKKNKG